MTIKKYKIPYVISGYLLSYLYEVKLFFHMTCRLVGGLEVELQSFIVLALERDAALIVYLMISEYYTTWHLKIL